MEDLVANCKIKKKFNYIFRLVKPFFNIVRKKISPQA